EALHHVFVQRRRTGRVGHGCAVPRSGAARPYYNRLVKPLAITLGDPSGIGAEVVFKALHTMSVPVRLFGSRAFAKPPADIDFVDVVGSGALTYGKISAEYGRIALDSIEAALRAIESG